MCRTQRGDEHTLFRSFRLFSMLRQICRVYDSISAFLPCGGWGRGVSTHGTERERGEEVLGLTDSVMARCRMSILLVSKAIPMACLYWWSVKQRWNILSTTCSSRGSMGPTPRSPSPSNLLADRSAYLSMHFAAEDRGRVSEHWLSRDHHVIPYI